MIDQMIQYIPLTFISSLDDLKVQIKNTIIMKHVLQKYQDVRTLGELLDSTQYGYTASASENGTHKFLRITDIQGGKVDWNTVPYCDCEREEKYLVKRGDILIARTGGTTGKSFIINEEAPSNAVFASYLIKLRTNENTLLPEYLNLFLNSYLYWSQIAEMKSGSAQPNVNANKLKTLKIPICNIEIQKALIDFFVYEKQQRINIEPIEKDATDTLEKVGNIYKVKELLGNQLIHCENYKIALLREVIKGQLVEQDPNDEPASELLKKLQFEKERQIREKIIKKEKKFYPISEIPYELPKGWEWVRINQIGELSRGKSKHRPRNDEMLYKDGIYPFVQTGDVARSNGLINTYSNMYNDEGLQQSRLWPKGTLCITIAANIADTGILNFDACFPDSVVGFIPFKPIQSGEYLQYFFMVAKGDLIEYAPSTAQKNINLEILNNLIIPLPPLNEMLRIVSRVKSLMEMCENLKGDIERNIKNCELLLQRKLQEVFQLDEHKDGTSV